MPTPSAADFPKPDDLVCGAESVLSNADVFVQSTQVERQLAESSATASTISYSLLSILFHRQLNIANIRPYFIKRFRAWSYIQDSGIRRQRHQSPRWILCIFADLSSCMTLTRNTELTCFRIVMRGYTIASHCLHLEAPCLVLCLLFLQYAVRGREAHHIPKLLKGGWDFFTFLCWNHV